VVDAVDLPLPASRRGMAAMAIPLLVSIFFDPPPVLYRISF
jgi:hypothetical protein